MIGTHGDFPPGDPARTIGRGNFLVVDARAVGERRGLALRLHGKREVGAQQRLALSAGERAERVVGVGDRALAVAANDDVALRLEKALGAFLRFLEFPVAILRLVETPLKPAQFGFHLADARQQDAHAAAGCAEQCGDADGERIRIVMRARGRRSRQKAESRRERHGSDGERADHERQEPAAEDRGLSDIGAIPHGLNPARQGRLARRLAASRPGLSM